MDHCVIVTFVLLSVAQQSVLGEGREHCFQEGLCHFSYNNLCQWSAERWTITMARRMTQNYLNYHMTLSNGTLAGTLTSTPLCALHTGPHCLRFDVRFGRVSKHQPDELLVMVRPVQGGEASVLWNVTSRDSLWHLAIVPIPPSTSSPSKLIIKGHRQESPWTSSMSVDNVHYERRACNGHHDVTATLVTSRPSLPPTYCSLTAVCLRHNKDCDWELGGGQWYLDHVIRHKDTKKVYSAYLRDNLTSGFVDSGWLCSTESPQTNTTAPRNAVDLLRSTVQEGNAHEQSTCLSFWVFLQMGHHYRLVVSALRPDSTCTLLWSLSLWTSHHRWRFISLPVVAESVHKIRISVERNEWSLSSVVAIDSISYNRKGRCTVAPHQDEVFYSPSSTPCVTSPPPHAVTVDSDDLPRDMPSIHTSDDNEDESPSEAQFIIRIVVISIVAVVLLGGLTGWGCHRRNTKKRRYKLARMKHRRATPLMTSPFSP